MRATLRYILAFCILLTAGNTFAQRYPFYNLNVEDGLIQSQATCMTQDHYGQLWIGTLGGLSRYDGNDFVNYTVRNGMLNNIVRDVTTDKHGNIWLCGPGGVSEYNGKIFTTYPFPLKKNNVPSSVDEITITADNTIWCRSEGKLYNIKGDSIQQVITPRQEEYVTAILKDSSDLWIAKAGTLFRLHNNKWDSLAMPANPMGRTTYVIHMYKGKEKRIWLTTNAGLYYVENGLVHIYYLENKPFYNLPFVYSITEDNSGSLWLGVTNGAIRIANNHLQFYNKHNGLTDNIIYKVFTDAEGNVWLGSDGQGIFRFSGTQFTALDESMGLPSAQIMAITAGKEGKLFLGTYDAGLYTFENGSISPLRIPNVSPAITALSVTNDGKLWIGTRMSGLWRYDRSFKQYSYPTYKFPAYTITALYADKYNRLWIAFPNGAILYENDSFKRLPFNLFSLSFISLSKDSTLIATNAGIKLYTNGTVQPYVTGTTLDSSEVECFVLKSDELWAGTSDNGVIDYNMRTGASQAINKKNGLKSDFIYNIAADNEGNIWVGTGFGIHKISIADQSKPLITFYGRGQGITGMESNHNAVYKMPDGSIWFGTTKGALHYQPHSKIITPKPISIVLQSVKVFGENITDSSYYDSTDNWFGTPYHLHLPYKKNNITFNFKAISLSGGEQILYRYSMEGIEAPWSKWSTTNSVTYSALPPGKYTFHVQCKTEMDDKHTKDLSYSFEITTPFQKTGWFRLIILGSCILIGVIIQYIANRRKQNRIDLMQRLRAEEQAKIRMRTAEDFHDEVGNKLTRINVLTNVLKNKIDNVTPDIDRILSQIQDNTGQLYSGTRDILWSLKPANDNLYQVLQRINEFGFDLFQDTEVEFIFTGIDKKWEEYYLPLDISRNLIMIFKEALNNCLKYSGANKVTIDVVLKNKNILQLMLKDNGNGFDIQHVKKGHGINNMNVRATRIHGKLYIDSHPHKGTIINLTFRLPERK